jgi:hypothetical protein
MSNLVVSANLVLYINGMPYAYVQDYVATIISPQKTLRGIDYLPGIEMAPMPVEYQVSATLYRKKGSGGLEGQGFLPQWNKATRGKYFSSIIMDRRTQEILFESQRNLVTSQTWRVQPKSILMGSVQWTGLGYKNDSDTLFS